MLKQNLEEFIQNEFLDNQGETAAKHTADACAKANATERYGTQICTNIESKTFIRNRSGQHLLFEESYQTFVDNSLDDRYISKSTDFKLIESIIAELDQESQVPILKVKSIAPFNSNLPVLNISELKPSVPSVPPLIESKLKKTKSSILNSRGKVLTNHTETPASSKLSCKKTSAKKRKRAKQSPLSGINVTNTLKTNIIEEKAMDNFEKEINNSLAAILQSSIESMSANSEVHIQAPLNQAIELDSDFTHVSSNNDAILKNNIENLWMKNMENFVAQQQQIQRQFELRTLYLRQKLDLNTCASCETFLPGMFYLIRCDLSAIFNYYF